MTAIAVLQCVERGQFSLDEDVTRYLPELSGIEILKGFEKDTQRPILGKAKKTLTLRFVMPYYILWVSIDKIGLID